MELMKTEQIISRIFLFQDMPVMIDGDLAVLYGVGTNVLNQTVKRNIGCFPAEYRFQMTENGFTDWKSQSVMSNSVKMSYLLTELLAKLPKS